MDHSRQTARLLHDEHMEEVAVLERLEGCLRKHAANRPPDTGDRELSSLLSALIAGIAGQVDRHFPFEETHLFPRLAENGEADIGLHLTGEHDAIREVAAAVVALAEPARDSGFDAAAWRDFHRLASELVERVISHIQKEEMAMLPILEDLLDADDDAQLALAYMENR